MTPARRPAGPLVGITAALLLALGTWRATPTLDLSAGRTYSLAPGTHRLLADVDDRNAPVEIEVFYAKAQPGFATVDGLVHRFDRASTAITSTFRDPDGPRALDLRVASGAVAATGPGGTAVVRTPDEADLAGIVARAAGLDPPTVHPNTAPTQPLTPTPLGRRLLWLLPTAAAPTLLAALGAAIVLKRRRP